MTFRELAPSLYHYALGLRDFYVWWRSELRRSIPPFLTPWLRERCPTITVLTITRDGCRLGDDSTLIPISEIGARLRGSSIGRDIGGRGLRVRLAADRCLRRAVSPRQLPISALRQAAALDVETETPFARGEVEILVPANQGAASGYYVVRSSILVLVEEQLRKARFTVRELSAEDENGVIHRLAVGGTRLGTAWRPRLDKAVIAAMIAATAVFVFLSLYLLHAKAVAVSSYLDEQIERAKGEARMARREYDAYVARLSQLAVLKSQNLNNPRATVMWEELSRIIPDSSYLTNLTFKDESVEISGFSTASSELIPLIEGSDHFEATQFLSPVVKVPGFDGDRFTISFRSSGAQR